MFPTSKKTLTLLDLDHEPPKQQYGSFFSKEHNRPSSPIAEQLEHNRRQELRRKDMLDKGRKKLVNMQSQELNAALLAEAAFSDALLASDVPKNTT